MTFAEARNQIPQDAEWSCSFGNPGEGGCSVHFHTKDGRRFVIDNGPWDALKPFNWTVRGG